MITSEAYADRRFYRSTENALLGGVCAGIADYFGFNLRALRFMAIIAFVVAMPMTVIAYLAAIFLIPARSATGDERVRRKRAERASKCSRRERRRAKREARNAQDNEPSQAANEIREKCQSLDQRIVELEKIITSSSYQLDREIRNL